MERYVAFISYSHADDRVARWLHRAIESYRFPRTIVGSESDFGPVQRRLPHVFRDRDELPASGDLNSELCAALADSRFQIVLCSPAAARSHWVNEEIVQFKRMNGEGRTLALIVDGEPYSGGDTECFPPALRFRIGPGGELTDEPAEPIAADIRKGKDGRKLALHKLLAGLSGVRLDNLVRRDLARRQRRLTIMAAASASIAVAMVGLAVYADWQRRVAVEQRELADRSLEFLIGTFEVANPATENPRTITALTILDRASKRAAREFENDPQIASRLLRTTGSIYTNLGLPAESRRDLRAALAKTPAYGEDRAATLVKLANLARTRSDIKMAKSYVEQADRAYDHNAPYAPRLNADLAYQKANVAYLEADWRAAADLFSDASGRYRRLDGDHREQVASALMSEGMARIQMREYPRAETLYAEAAGLMIAKFGIDDFRSARALQNQALSYFVAGHPAQAAPLLQRAITVYDRVLGDAHPNLGEAQLLLGRINAARGEADAALAAFRRARRIFARLYGIDNATVGDIDFFTAEAESSAGRYRDALAHADSAKAIYDINYGPDDPDQAEVMLLRSRILRAAGRSDESRQACQDALNLQKKLGFSDEDRASASEQCGINSVQLATNN